MPRRTLREARRILEEDLLPQLSDYQAGQGREWLAAAETEARQRAEEYAAERADEVRGVRDAALRDLTAVRDGYEDLAGEGKTGRLSARDYADRLAQLRERQDQAEADLSKAEAQVSLVERIDADPIAWFDELAGRFPSVMREVPW